MCAAINVVLSLSLLSLSLLSSLSIACLDLLQSDISLSLSSKLNGNVCGYMVLGVCCVPEGGAEEEEASDQKTCPLVKNPSWGKEGDDRRPASNPGKLPRILDHLFPERITQSPIQSLLRQTDKGGVIRMRSIQRLSLVLFTVILGD